MLRLERETLNDRAYGALKQGLISGQFRPGHVFVIRKLAESFGISTTPIREALQRLVAERTLSLQHNRSIAVPVLSNDTFRELMRIRCAVEGLAGEIAAERMADAHIEQARDALRGMDLAIAEGDGRRYLALNEEFHFTIYTQAGAPILLGTIRDLWGRAGPYMTYLIDLASYMPRGNDLHRSILAALEARNGEDVKRQVVTDITTAADAMMPLVRSQTAPNG
jgi:DNA-binding GntR family transcriptional regulator